MVFLTKKNTRILRINIHLFFFLILRTVKLVVHEFSFVRNRNTQNFLNNGHHGNSLSRKFLKTPYEEIFYHAL